MCSASYRRGKTKKCCDNRNIILDVLFLFFCDSWNWLGGFFKYTNSAFWISSRKVLLKTALKRFICVHRIYCHQAKHKCLMWLYLSASNDDNKNCGFHVFLDVWATQQCSNFKSGQSHCGQPLQQRGTCHTGGTSKMHSDAWRLNALHTGCKHIMHSSMVTSSFMPHRQAGNFFKRRKKKVNEQSHVWHHNNNSTTISLDSDRTRKATGPWQHMSRCSRATTFKLMPFFSSINWPHLGKQGKVVQFTACFDVAKQEEDGSPKSWRRKDWECTNICGVKTIQTLTLDFTLKRMHAINCQLPGNVQEHMHGPPIDHQAWESQAKAHTNNKNEVNVKKSINGNKNWVATKIRTECWKRLHVHQQKHDGSCNVQQKCLQAPALANQVHTHRSNHREGTVDAAHNDVRWLIKLLLICELELGVAHQVISSVEMPEWPLVHAWGMCCHFSPGVVSTWLWHGSYVGSHVSVWLLSSVDPWCVPGACARNDPWCTPGAYVGPWLWHAWLISPAYKHRFNTPSHNTWSKCALETPRRILFVKVDWSHFCVMFRRMLFCDMIAQIFCSGMPGNACLLLQDLVEDPETSHFHGTGTLSFQRAVCCPCCRSVITVHGGGWLWVAHFLQHEPCYFCFLRI